MQRIAVIKESYMYLSDAFDVHSKKLMSSKGEEYSLDGDFLAMENLLAGLMNEEPEYISLTLAGKHVAALVVILTTNMASSVKLDKLDERVRDACNLLKIMAAFIHAKQNDFALHLGKDETSEPDTD